MSENLPAAPPETEAYVDPWVSFIERAMRDPAYDTAKLAMLMEVRDKERQDARLQLFQAAMVPCQSEMSPIVRKVLNPAVHKKYATLEDIDRTMRPIYNGHGFAVEFGSEPGSQPGWIRVICTVSHRGQPGLGGYMKTLALESAVSGQGSQGGRTAMTPPQAVGATVTYLRRYLMLMAFNIITAEATPDHDGEEQRKSPNTRPQSGNGRPPDPPDDGGLDIDWTDEPKVQLWLTRLAQGLGMMRHQSEIDEAANGPKVTDGRARAPDRVRVEIDALFAEAYARTLEGEAP